MKCMSSQLPQSKLSRSGHAKPGGGLVSWGSDWPSGSFLMCTFWHDFGLWELSKFSAEKLAKQNLGRLVPSAVVFGQHTTGHLVILTFLVDQSILGLCSTSHVCLRIMVIQPIPVTWKVACSEWSL